MHEVRQIVMSNLGARILELAEVVGRFLAKSKDGGCTLTVDICPNKKLSELETDNENLRDALTFFKKQIPCDYRERTDVGSEYDAISCFEGELVGWNTDGEGTITFTYIGEACTACNRTGQKYPEVSDE